MPLSSSSTLQQADEVAAVAPGSSGGSGGGGGGTGIEVIQLDASGGAVTETLPAPSSGATALALRVDTSTGNTATLETAGSSQEIRFAEGKNVSSTTLDVEQSLLLSSDGSHWYVEEGQGLSAEAESVTTDAATKDSPSLTQTATYDSDGTTSVTSSDVTIERYVRTDNSGNATLVYEAGGTEIARLTDQGTIRARQDVVAFGLSGGSSSGSSSNLAAPGDALTLSPGPDPDEIEFTQDIEDSNGNFVLSGAETIQFKGNGVSSVTGSGSRVEVDISGGSNVGSLSDLNDVGSAGAGNGEVLVGDNTNYNSTLLSTAAGSHLDLADLNNAQYSSLTGTPSIPVAGDGLDNNSGDFDIDVSDFAGDGLTSNANDLDVGSTVARTNQAETFDNTITITADGTSKEGFVLNDSSGGFIGEFRNNGGNANFRAASGADFGIGINGTGGAEIKIVDGIPSFTAFSVAGSEVGRFKSGGVFDVSGDITASGEVEAFVSSDRRLKTDLDPVGSALDKVDQLTGYGFDWRKGDAVQPHKRGKTDVGLIAQEVEDVLPEAVKTFTDGHSKGYKSVSYDKLVPLLIEAIKDLREQIEAQ